MIAFAENVERDLFQLIPDLKGGRYSHGKYSRFVVYDPKRREIAKAPVRDRILHRAVHRVLVPIFESGFIFDSYSSRKEKGIHAAGKRLRKFAEKLSRNRTKTVWVLQADVRKFFDSIDHEILLALLRKRVKDKKTMRLLEVVVRSFEVRPGKGVPLGNLTSQLFSNVCLDPLDQFVKRDLRAECYLRYADDIAILSRDRNFLESCLSKISAFLGEKLKIEIHQRKTVLKKWHEGVDFLGYMHFPFYAVLRTKTKRRIFKKLGKKKEQLETGIIDEKVFDQSLQSYLGVLKHCRGKEIAMKIKNLHGTQTLQFLS